MNAIKKEIWMSRWDGINRRKFPRANYPCMVVLAHQGDSKKEFILAHTENIGVGGICLILKKDIKTFSEVDLELDLMDLQEHIRCKGRIVWNVLHREEFPQKGQSYDLGIEFESVEKKDQQRLNDVVRKMAIGSKTKP